MAEDEAWLGGGAPTDHVLVGAADVGGHNLEDDLQRTKTRNAPSVRQEKLNSSGANGIDKGRCT